MSPRGTAKISAAIRLRTVEIYLETGSFKITAQALSVETGIEIHPSSVRQRVIHENLLATTEPRDIINILDRLQREVEAEKSAGVNLPDRGETTSELPLDEQIRTLEAFIENSRYQTTGRTLGITGAAVKNRLVKILGEKIPTRCTLKPS